MKGYQKKKVSANNVAPDPCHVTTAAGTEVGQGRTCSRSAPRAPALGHPYVDPQPTPPRQGCGSLPAPTAGRAPAKTSPLGALVSVHREQLLGTAARAKGPGCPSRSQWAAS